MKKRMDLPYSGFTDVMWYWSDAMFAAHLDVYLSPPPPPLHTHRGYFPQTVGLHSYLLQKCPSVF